MTIAFHLVAHTRRGFRGVVEPVSARWLWAHLRAGFPTAYALCLMPDHLHLIVPAGYDEMRWRRVLEHHGRIFGTSWDRLDPTRCTTTAILGRTIRYVMLNPVREGLVDDPWKWPWSTLRDLAGVIIDPWTREHVRAVTHGPWPRVLAYLTSRGGATPGLVRPLDLGITQVVSLDAIAAAVASALRSRPEDIRQRGATRRLFVQVALACGHVPRGELARACGITLQAIRRIQARVDRAALECAMRCLQDERLRMHDVALVRRDPAAADQLRTRYG